MRFPLLFLLIAPLTLFAQNTHWQSKIDPLLWAYAQNPDTSVEFLVILQVQADVSAAKQMRSKTDKGQYVFETLSTFAESSQRKLRDLLQLENVPHQSFWIVNGLWVKASKKLIEQIAKMPEVGRLEINPVWHLEEPMPEVTTATAQDRLTPISWGLTKINADDVWAMGYTGQGIVVGGQDTGYEWGHPAIKNKYRGWNGSTADHNYNWHDAIHALIGGGANSCGLNLDHPCDDHDHGTHTMGTMVGGPNADSIIGVAPNAVWMGCRNMEEGDGTPATYTECFQWFVAPTNLANQSPDASKAPHVINNSWSCPGSEGCNASNYATMEAVVNNVRAAGIFVVVSAGNEGPGCSTVNAPAGIFDASYTVGATNSNDDIAGFSSRGPVTVYTNIKKPDISAPGVAIVSCIGHDNASGSYSYASWNGTSMAGPHIAGVVALILSARPDLIGSVDAVENVINNTALPRFSTAFCGGDNGSTRPNNMYGWGRVDALAAVNTALPIELLDFSVKAAGKGVLLEWTTSIEINCAHFNLQRSSDGFSWQKFGEVSCNGSAAPSETSYSFLDVQPNKGANYYRFEQVDLSGDRYYSPIRALTIASTGYALRLSTSDGKAFYQVLGDNANAQTWQLEICALDGRILLGQAVGSKGWLELPAIPKGMYLAVLRDERGVVMATEKMLILR